MPFCKYKYTKLCCPINEIKNMPFYLYKNTNLCHPVKKKKMPFCKYKNIKLYPSYNDTNVILYRYKYLNNLIIL